MDDDMVHNPGVQPYLLGDTRLLEHHSALESSIKAAEYLIVGLRDLDLFRHLVRLLFHHGVHGGSNQLDPTSFSLLGMVADSNTYKSNNPIPISIRITRPRGHTGTFVHQNGSRNCRC